jgi:hypothetical protein
MPVPFSGRRKPTPRFVRIASMQDSDVTPPYVLLLPTDMNGEPTTNWTTTTWVKEEVPVPPLFSFPIFPSSDLFLLLPRMPRAANVPRLGRVSPKPFFFPDTGCSPACRQRDPAQSLISCLGMYHSKVLPQPLVPCSCQWATHPTWKAVRAR